jgi:phosphoserine phosphatase
MDGVIFKDINFWLELHKKFGTFDEGKELTKKYLHTDYNKLVEEVVGRLWKGKDAKAYFELINGLKYLRGVAKVFDYVKKNNWVSAIVSASSIDVARRVQRDFGVDYIYANELVIKDGKISGEFVWPIGAGNENKSEIIRHLARDLKIDLKEVIYVGDSDTDLAAFRSVGKSIAFNSSSNALKREATHIVDSNNLAEILKHLSQQII